MRTAKSNWAELAISVVIVALIASVWPTNPLMDLAIQFILSLALLGAFQLARRARDFGLPTRTAFWSWFVVMCGVWPLALWKLISNILFPQPPSIL